MAHEPSDVLQLQLNVLSKHLVRLSIRLFVDAFTGFNELSCNAIGTVFSGDYDLYLSSYNVRWRHFISKWWPKNGIAINISISTWDKEY